MSSGPAGHCVDEPPDRLRALVPADEGRHLPHRVLGEQLDDARDVLALHGAGVAVQQLSLAGSVGSTMSSSGGWRAGAGPGPAAARCSPRRSRSRSASATSAADHRSTSRRISTARWRGGRCCSAATRARRTLARAATIAGRVAGGAAEQGVRHRLQPGHLGLLDERVVRLRCWERRARSAAGGGCVPPARSGRRSWRCGRARCAATTGPRTRGTTARHAGRSPARGPRRRASSRASGSSARSSSRR